MVSEQSDQHSDYYKLWDFCLRHPHATEQEAKLKLKWSGERKLSVSQSYLFDFILRVLGNFHIKNTSTGLIQEEMNQIEFLFLKGLIPVANRNLLKLKTECKQVEIFDALLQILALEQKIIYITADLSKLEPLLSELQNEHLEILACLYEIQLYKNIFSKLYGKTQYLSPYEDNESKIISSDLLQILSQSITPFKTKTGEYYVLMIQSNYFLYVLQYTKAQEIASRAMELLENNPYIWHHDPERLIETIRLLLRAAFYAENYFFVLNLIEKGKTYLKNKKLPVFLANQLEIYFLHIELCALGETHQWEKAANLSPVIESTLNKMDGKTSLSYYIMLHYNLAQSELFVDRVSSALKRVHKILTYRDLEMRQDGYLYTLLLQILLLIQNEDWNLAEYKLRNAKRTFEEREKSDAFTKLLFQLLSDLIKNGTGKLFQDALLHFIHLMDSSENDPEIMKHLKFFDFRIWAKKMAGMKIS